MVWNRGVLTAVVCGAGIALNVSQSYPVLVTDSRIPGGGYPSDDATAPDGRRPVVSTPGARSQVGIGTLVIFIALILVATITAGVLFETAGIFQTQTEQTGGETSQKLSDQLEVIAVTGNNITNTDPHEIHRVKVIVTVTEGSGTIDLRNVTVQWRGDGGAFSLVHEETTGGVTTDKFSTKKFSDLGNTYPALSSTEDRFALVFEPGVEFGSSGIGEGEDVELKIIAPAGSSRTVRFTAPGRLSNTDSIEL
jgi:flagellin FlaB